jgi:DNA-binding response OmpR family regulator
MFREDAPTVTILDWMMPGLDGPEMCLRLRRMGHSVYLVLLTAFDSEEHRAEGRLA